MAYQPTDDELLVRESDLKAGLLGKSNVGHSHSWTEVTGKPSTFSPSAHTHSVADITGSGTKNNTTFFRGDGTWAVPVDTTYQTLTQAQVTAGTETVGKLVTAKIIGDTINTAVAGKANASHTHAISDITGLQTAINAKANSSHTHTINDISATGTKNSTTFLRGDGTWAVIDLGDGTVNAANITGAAGSGLNLSSATVKVNTTTSSLSSALELLDTKAQTLFDNYTTLSNTVSGKANATHTHSIDDITASGSKNSATFLRGDGIWATPTNTTYTTMTQAEATAGTITTGRVISSKVLKDAIIEHSPGGVSTGQMNTAVAGVKEWTQSRGTNLITNGTGFFGDNTNFTGAVFDPTDAPPGIRGSFVPPAHGGSLYAGEVLPVNPANRYVVKYWARQRIEGATNLGRHYSLLAPMDAYGHAISPFHYCYQPGTTTALAADLAPGDTYVSLVSADNWYNGSENHRRTLTFWNYVDQGGKAWGIETYTRNYYGSIYAAGGINYTNNRVSLIEPWSGPLITAGTPLSNGQSGGNYIYPVTSFVPEEWTEYGGYVAAATNYTGQPSTSDTGWPPGTGMAQLGFLTNYQAASGVSEHAFAGIEFAPISDPESLADGSIPESKLRGPTAIGSGANLNDYTTTGKYHQGSDAAAQGGTNYPVGFAGLLEVVASTGGAMIYQMYRTYGGQNKVYVRSWYGYTSFWGPWKELSEVGHNHPVGDLTASGTRSSSTYLRGDGTWATPPNTNTTYSTMSQAEATNASSTTARLATGQRLRQAADAAITAREWTGTQAQYNAIGTKNPNITYYVVEG